MDKSIINSNHSVASFTGNMLVMSGKVTREQVAEALILQRSTKEKLGQVLVKLGYCTEEDVAEALSAKFGYKSVSLNEIGVDMSAANMITPDKAEKYHLLPVMKDGKNLYVAMRNPDDIIAIDDLQILTGYTIRPLIVSDSELTAAIKNYVNMSRNLAVSDRDDETIADTENQLDSDNSDDKPAVNFVNQMLSAAVKSGASDVHVEPQEKFLRVRFRIDGVLHEVMQQPQKMQSSILSRIKIMGGMDIAERRIPLDGRATIKVDDEVLDIRIASLPSVYGEAITLRLLSRASRTITISELGFSDYNSRIINAAIAMPYGFIIAAGPTGSGKSTSLYALLMQLNKEDKNIITLEDPVERRFAGINQVQMNNRAGMTFASGLRSILRSDPDIIMIGEVRDKETAKIAVESALTGHFVLSTLHTNDAASSVTRLTEMGVDPFLTASSVVAVVAQRLVRVLCPKCKVPKTFKKRELREKIPDFPFDSNVGDDDDVTIYEPGACISCNGTGYRGRRGVYEIMAISNKIKDAILKNESANTIKQYAIDDGMITLREDGLLKVKNGVTSYEEVLRVIV